MDKDLFNNLFDRPTENPDFLRARIASVITDIAKELLENLRGDYNEAFYISTNNYLKILSKNFDDFTLKKIHLEIKNFKSFLFKIFNFSNTCRVLESENQIFFKDYIQFAKFCGYEDRSRILRRYRNFCKISKNFKAGKINIQNYRKEILNHIIFFDEISRNISNFDNYQDMIIYLFVYDIRSSQKIREKVK